MSQPRAACIVFAGLLLCVACLATPWPVAQPKSDGGATDDVTFRTMVSRLRTGEPYYRVFGDELRRRRYPALSVFNWRTPLLLVGLARVPDAAARGTLIMFGVLLFGAALSLAARESLWVAASSIMVAGAVVPTMVPACLMMGETWAGVLIGLSVCMYSRNRVYPAVALGVLALFVRELAAPYCVACTVAALVKGRRGEVAAWLAGACLYGLYFGWHALQVSAHQLPSDFAHESPVIGLHGLTLLLTKVRYHAWLLVLPPWCTALALTVVVAGTASARTPLHVRLASGVYAGFFLVAGRTFNGYWGLIAWPAWAMAFGYGLQMFRDAVWAFVPSRPPGRQPPAAAAGSK